jgi:hypothetical protein
MSAQPDKRAPFFIVGCGRSGTTLLRTMLNRHSLVAIPLESLFIVDYLQARESVDHERLVQMLVREFELREWGLEVDANDLSEATNARGAIERLHEIYLAKNRKQIWGQKTPRFVRYGDVLKRAWPSSKFVHIVRDPRAVASSLIRSDAHRSNAYFAARRWVKDVSAGLDLQRRFPKDVLLLRYEELVRRPEEQLKIVCKHLDIRYEDGIATPESGDTREYSPYYANIHELLSRPPDPERIDLWQRTLTPRQVHLIEQICGTLMTSLNYQTMGNKGRANAPYISTLLAERAIGTVSQFIKYRRERRGYLASFLRRKLTIRGIRESIIEGLR